MRRLPYWIKERHNPQIGVYYVASGQMSAADARKIERGTLYGDNRMLRFNTETEYAAKLASLRKSGESVR